jgi:hypothetical protein
LWSERSEHDEDREPGHRLELLEEIRGDELLASADDRPSESETADPEEEA